MATTLKKTNVVIIGLGAAGGVACLPLARAGLEVIGLEAGNWLSTKDMAPDRTNGAYLQKTTLPYEDNYLDLDPTMKDPLGFPVIRITAEYKNNWHGTRTAICG